VAHVQRSGRTFAGPGSKQCDPRNLVAGLVYHAVDFRKRASASHVTMHGAFACHS